MYRVLLVDDEPFIVEGLQDAIDWSAYELEVAGTAGSGKAALELLAQRPADLLVTDITMPGMTGLELIREARKLLPDLKVIILSGYNEFDYLKEGMSLGIENYLLKPVNFQELRSTLTATIAKLNAAPESRSILTQEEQGILRDRILYRWMRGEIDPDELRQRSGLLGLNLDQPWLVAASVRHVASGGAYARRIIEAALPEPSAKLRFTDLDGDEILLFLADTPEEAKQKASDTLGTLVAADSGKLEEGPFYSLENEAGRSGPPLRLTLGTAERIGRLEQRSYALAKKTQDYHLLRSDSPVLDAAELTQTPAGLEQPLDLGGGEYSRWLLARDTNQLFARIDSDFLELQQRKGATPELLTSAAIELAVAFRLELRDMKGGEQSQEVLFHFKKTLDRISRSSTLEELTDAIKASAHFTMEQLQRSDRVPIVNQVILHVAGHYQELLSLKTLGAIYHIHPAYLGQLFSKETGSSFTEYLNRYRIERAKERLKDTDDKIADISREVGYVETGYFYKQFKKHVGISPNDYRELR
ncbi:response regulator transcription factor [Paenibacillus pasadenensis]|uniref:response regulator transcription factor n=1 Tax=Paenibacillus pasadenensis TaxID=217090 RepID=UPI00203C9293|nr:response regulator transcription factor [Paenibacillus pasadenensis]MCM3749624.1 response regulator transcription factor [Paenibacillus pasadenensis]